MKYIGRFAPSPTGPLHFGSLVAAVASYLDAKANQGKWLVRIEDLDIPRCQPSSPEQILSTLKAHQLIWDEDVLYQSTRTAAYHNQVDNIVRAKQGYFCQCTRKTLRQQGGIHSPDCRNKHADSGAIRFINQRPIRSFSDRLKGRVDICDDHALEDFIIFRRDKLHAYNLAVVVDDVFQGVTHIVRGDDLLETTSAQLTLYRELHYPEPAYMHIPVITNSDGLKLSKQNHAPAVDDSKAKNNLLAAFSALGLQIGSLQKEQKPSELLQVATYEWREKHPVLPL